MLIYNVTTKVNWEIHEAWLQWMKEKHLPDVMDTGCFTDVRLVRLLETDDSEGPTYAAQFHADSREQYQRYIDAFAPAMRKDVVDNWGANFISFRSLMEVVN
ncbi:DUF4286 family protein [Sediminibacterium soli]|uniref:DUF4286 family protein n=1 Tax=Sediminibacterium soli TaxID=2698829 RepID=UPI00137B56B7|nr:DUF4286 family protein [Sediminibacterium soli]NCI47733.1 DUF4286 family protein [Sediminibacterium soli]